MNPKLIKSTIATVSLLAALSCSIHSARAQTLGQALDQPAWTWFNIGPAPWRAVYWPGTTGDWCALVGNAPSSPGIPSSGVLETTVTGPGTLSFSHAMDGLQFNGFQFQVDYGSPVGLNSFLGFSLYTVNIPAGVHVLTWTCVFGSTSSGALDNIVFSGGSVAPAITTTSPLPIGAIGSLYSQTLVASGGMLPYTWTVLTGSLPPGLGLSSGGVISGTPTTITNVSVVIKVAGADGAYTNKAFDLTIGAASPSIGGISPLLGTIGRTVDFGLPLSGSIPPYTWSITNGSTPPGVTFNSSVFTGVPTKVTNATLTVRVVGGNGLSDSRTFDFIVGPAITNGFNGNNHTLPSGGVGAAYSQSLIATGGVAPYSYELSSGGLPLGLSLGSGGAITGTPAQVTNASFHVQVTDNLGRYSRESFSLAVTAPPTITTTSPLPEGMASVAYNLNLAATGGTTPYVWTLLSGSLPDGLSLSTNGAISGTPGAAANFNFTVRVADANGLSTNKSLALLISPAISLAEALDQSYVAFTNYGNLPWVPQAGVTHDGVDAVRSGAIGNSQQSVIETSVKGPGNVGFWWKVSSESNYDFLTFYIDGVMQGGRISGTVDWQQKTYVLTNGSHALKWIYSKDSSYSVGLDCGWLDQLTVPPPLAPALSMASSNGWPMINLAGEVGRQCVLQSSPDLVGWTSVTTNVIPPGGSLSWPIFAPADVPCQFFRALILP